MSPKTGVKICPVCGIKHKFNPAEEWEETGEFENSPAIAYQICSAHYQKIQEGFVICVGVDPERSKISDDGSLEIDNAWRTGEILYIHRDKIETILETPPPENNWMFLDCAVAQHIISKGGKEG